MRSRPLLVVLLPLALGLLPLTAHAVTYQVQFGVSTGGPAPTGTITFADPVPANGVVNIDTFSITDGTHTWTGADQLGSFHQAGFADDTLQYVALKVVDTATGWGIELFSSGNPGGYQICTSADADGVCTQITPHTTGPCSYVQLADHPVTYDVQFGVSVGGPAPSGTITFLTVLPSDGAVNIDTFSITDGTHTWDGDDQLGSFHQAGFAGDTLQYVALKVVDTASGWGLELFSSGNPGSYQICTTADANGVCTAISPTTAGPCTYVLLPPVPLAAPWVLGFGALALLAIGMWGMRARRVA